MAAGSAWLAMQKTPVEKAEKRMNITIHRATSPDSMLIEISTAKTKIILDGGVNLEENEVLVLAELQAHYALTGVDAAFLSHYSTDHITMARGLLDDVPVYGGKLASSIALAAEGYKAKKPVQFAGYYAHGTPIVVGDITVTPHLVDIPDCEGYLLLIEGEGKRVLYTGDFHANGRKSFEEMLAGLPQTVDVLLCERGVLTERDISLVTERDLEEQAAKLIEATKGPVFVLQSVTDFSRAATFLYAAKRNNRVFLQDLYTAHIAAAAGKAMPNPVGWAGVKAYLTTGYKPEHPRYKLFAEMPRMSKTTIVEQAFVMCVRPTMKKFMKTLALSMPLKHGLVINALPDEGGGSADPQTYLAFAEKMGMAVVPLRVSGHANALALKTLIETVKPTKLVPLVRQNAGWFRAEHPTLTVVTGDNIQC